MGSKLITKIKNRIFYYYDLAISNGKKLTIKYCLYTNDSFDARLIAMKIKNSINENLAKVFIIVVT